MATEDRNLLFKQLTYYKRIKKKAKYKDPHQSFPPTFTFSGVDWVFFLIIIMSYSVKC